ncbi:hypothetical protein ACJEIK_04250 [Mycobacterium sp. SMC-16]|uniref:hypothetical protein n=1 Tax=Mycobacterium sp. SMC-16 TaxID=3385967 RepID=UPI00390CBDB1
MPRTHQFLITLMVHTTKLKPAGHATDHIGKINDEWPPRDSHPERRSTGDGGPHQYVGVAGGAFSAHDPPGVGVDGERGVHERPASQSDVDIPRE